MGIKHTRRFCIEDLLDLRPHHEEREGAKIPKVIVTKPSPK
jgi:hypothetical protein